MVYIMATNYITIKVTKETSELIEKAKGVYIAHNQSVKDFYISKNRIIKKALNYYITN